MQSSNFSKSIRSIHNRHRRKLRLFRERTLATIKAVSMSVGAFGFVLGAPGQALAANLPTGANVTHGQVAIQQQGADALRILQQSQSAIINWQSFDIGSGAAVDIIQPNIDAALLSRVVGGNPSEILGSLNANGRLFLVNPNGIIFGKDSTVDVHALIASTLDIADSAFLSGNISFTGDSEAAVINLGSINAESFAALIGGKVDNSGSITVPGGDAALLSGDATLEIGEAEGGKILLDLSGLLEGLTINSGSIDVSSDDAQGGSATILGERILIEGSVDASGSEGGGTILVGGDYKGENANLSNASATVLAAGASLNADAIESGDGGKVILWADDVTKFHGSISATGGLALGDGGFVETSGKDYLEAYGSVDVSAAQGQGGTWLLDPRNITISSTTLDGSFDSGTPNTFTPSGDSATVAVSSIVASLEGGSDVTITTGGGTRFTRWRHHDRCFHQFHFKQQFANPYPAGGSKHRVCRHVQIHSECRIAGFECRTYRR